MAWSPFSFDTFGVDSLPNITTDGDLDEGIISAELKEEESDDIFSSYQLTKESNIFEESDEIFADFDDDDDDEDLEEHCGKCKAECGDDDSLFDEAASILEAVLDDGEDDIIADDVDDMTDEDDEEIDADAEGIEEIEQDIIDDEEDDLIDMAMEAED